MFEPVDPEMMKKPKTKFVAPVVSENRSLTIKQFMEKLVAAFEEWVNENYGPAEEQNESNT